MTGVWSMEMEDWLLRDPLVSEASCRPDGWAPWVSFHHIRLPGTASSIQPAGL